MKFMALLQRELHAYFFSPMAYLIMAAYLFFTGYSTAFIFDIYNQNRLDLTMREIFSTMEFFSIFLVPLISMRLIAEERKSGTLEMLVTAPIDDLTIILAKFAGSLVFYVVLHIPTLVYLYVMHQHANPEYGSVITGYLGLLLVGALYLSIGLLVSAVARDQIVASLVTFVALFVLYTISSYAQSITSTAFGIPWQKVVAYIGFLTHYESFRKGVLDSRDLVYFSSVTVVFLFLSVRALESRRWR